MPREKCSQPGVQTFTSPGIVRSKTPDTISQKQCRMVTGVGRLLWVLWGLMGGGEVQDVPMGPTGNPDIHLFKGSQG